MFERLVQVRSTSGKLRHLAIPEGVLSLGDGTANSATMLRITLPDTKPTSLLAAFLSTARDASNSVLTFLDADSWLELEISSPAGRASVATSGCWLTTALLDGHSLRFRPDHRKEAYVKHRQAVRRVAKAFEDLRRFARSPASVFNPGATLAETFDAEQQAGVVFPEEVRASFTLFNGQARSAWLRSEGVIGGFELLSLRESVELMLEEACFRAGSGPPEFVPLANKRNGSEWLAAAVDGGRVCVLKPLSRPKYVAKSWSYYLRVQ